MFIIILIRKILRIERNLMILAINSIKSFPKNFSKDKVSLLNLEHILSKCITLSEELGYSRLLETIRSTREI